MDTVPLCSLSTPQGLSEEGLIQPTSLLTLGELWLTILQLECFEGRQCWGAPVTQNSRYSDVPIRNICLGQ